MEKKDNFFVGKTKKHKKIFFSKKPINVKELLALYSVEELCQTAEDYYKNIDDISGLLKNRITLLKKPQNS